jgi:hypothetical protein
VWNHADRRQAKSCTEAIVPDGKVFSEALPGFWVNASWLWATPLPNRFTCLEEILRGT